MRAWTKSLLVLLAVAQASTAEDCRVPLNLSLEVATPIETAVPVALALTPLGEGVPLPAASAPGTAEVSVPRGETFRLVASAPGWWSAPATVRCPEEGEAERIALSLLPTGPVVGQVRVSRGSKIPHELEVAFAAEGAIGGGEAWGLGEVACPVAEDGAWRCELPLGSYDLRLRHPGFAPVYRWGVEIERSGHGLGEVELVPGASVAGFLVMEEQLVSPAELWVELSPEPAGRPAPAAGSRLAAMALRATPDERGFFQLVDVPPGVYRLRAGGAAFVPVALAPVRVVAGKESRLREPLRLAQPATFEVVLAPPVAPDGTAWRLSLDPVPQGGGSALESFRGTTDPAGTWSRREVPPGEYLLTIGSGRGRWLRRQVSVGGWSPPLALTLDAVEVRGVVRAGDEPVVGTLYFGDRQDDVRIEAETDAAGGLDLTLPRPGEWPVSLLVEGSQQVVVLEPVRVEVAEPDEPAWLEVVLPDTRLSGVVVDGGDEPVPGATVWLFTPERALRDRSEAETDEDGRFELVGVPPAEYQVHAELPDRSSRLGVAGTSDRQRVRVAAGRPAEEVRLVLHRFFDVQGRVVSAGGPVAGAAVTVHPDAGTQRLIGPIDSTVTGPTGSFQATVPERATAVTLVVVAPGHAARVMRLPVRPGEPIEVPVSPEGGRLSLLLGEWSHRRPPMLHTAGTWVPLQDLAPRRVATAEGPRWILPLLTPGDYYLCTGVRLDAACQGGSLAAGSDLSVDGRAALAAP